MTEIPITISDRDRLVEVNQGDTIVISLDENLTTGYEWKIASVDNQIIEPIASKYLKKSAVGLGVGGTREVRFQAMSSGQARIQLQLRRSWEPADAATEHFAVNVHVLPSSS